MKSRFVTLTLMLVAALALAGNPPDSIVSKPSRYIFSIRSAVLPCADCYHDGKIAGLLSTVHGFRLNRNFSTGIGAGLTSAGSMWIVPVFGNFRINMYGKKQNTNNVFLEMNYGWGLAPANVQHTEYGSQTTRCRSYFQPSIGYSIAYHDLRIGFMIGIQAIKTTTVYEYPGYSYSWGLFRAASPNVTEFDYSVGRFLAGISIGWRE